MHIRQRKSLPISLTRKETHHVYHHSFPFIVGFILTIIGATFLWTWIFNHARGSLIIAILVHAGFNASSGLLALLIPAHPSLSAWAEVILKSEWLNRGNLPIFVVCAVLLLIATRGRLGYTSDRAPQLREEEDTNELGAVGAQPEDRRSRLTSR